MANIDESIISILLLLCFDEAFCTSEEIYWLLKGAISLDQSSVRSFLSWYVTTGRKLKPKSDHQFSFYGTNRIKMSTVCCLYVVTLWYRSKKEYIRNIAIKVLDCLFNGTIVNEEEMKPIYLDRGYADEATCDYLGCHIELLKMTDEEFLAQTKDTDQFTFFKKLLKLTDKHVENYDSE